MAIEKIPQGYISRPEAAKIMGVHPQSISNYLDRGLFKGKKHTSCTLVECKSFYAFMNSTDFKELQSATNALKEDVAEVEKLRREVEVQKQTHQFRLDLLKAHGVYHKYLQMGLFDETILMLIDAEYLGYSNALKEREKDILKQVIHGTTFDEIARGYVLSRDRVRQIFWRGIRKLKENLAKTNELNEELTRLRERCSRQHNIITMQECYIKELEEKLSVKEDVMKQRVCNIKPDPEGSQLERIMYLRTTNACDFFQKDVFCSRRLINCIKSFCYTNTETLFDVVTTNESTFLKYRNFGRKSLRELEDVLGDRGLYLGMSFPEDMVQRLVDAGF